LNPGVYLVCKEVGKSSFDVVHSFKREVTEAGCGKMVLGHGGTLDPFADGLLLILAGQATRLMDLMHCLPKTYLAKVTWGIETDTCDHLGLPVAKGVVPEGMPVNEALLSFLGWQDQIPPDTCAKKINGEPAYKKVHRGEVVVLSPSRVYLHSASWVSHDMPNSSTLQITCKGGYYVRALARDLGRMLGCKAHLSALTRTSIGPWSVPAIGSRQLVQGEELIPWCKLRVLDSNEADQLCYGRPVPLGAIQDASWSAPTDYPVFNQPIRGIYQDKLVALMQEKDGALWTHANLRGGI
jgi:tRNA pseudouridine55 synthase